MRIPNRIATFICLAGLPIGAQNVDPKAMLNPPADSWLTYHGDYTGQRHSKLTQITPENVGRLIDDAIDLFIDGQWMIPVRRVSG